MASRKEDAPASGSPAPEAPATGSTSIVKKITLKNVMGKIARPEPNSAPVALYRIIGIAHGFKTGSTSFGPWVAFHGSFEAVNLINGERFASGIAFVPKSVEDLLFANLRDAQTADANASIQFALEVGIKPHPTSPVGYEITCKPLVKFQANSALDNLRSQALTFQA